MGSDMANFLGFNPYISITICLALTLSSVVSLSHPRSLFFREGNTIRAHEPKSFSKSVLRYEEAPRTASLAEQGAIHRQRKEPHLFNAHGTKDSEVKLASTRNNAMPRNRRPESSLKSNFSQTFAKRLESIGNLGKYPRCPNPENCHKSACRSKTIFGDKCCKLLEDGYLNCSCCQLEQIPQVSDPKNVFYLDLSFNFLTETSLQEDVFFNYSNLQLLDLTCNKISNLREGVFNGLSNLQSLSLLWNFLTMDQHLNASKAFQPLAASLQTLILCGNNPNVEERRLQYPDYALSFLTQLSTLWLDGLLNKTFGQYFSHLQNLQELKLAGFCPGYCNLTLLNKDMFNHLSSISRLNITDCHLLKSYEETLVPLTNLKSLDVSNNFGLPIAEVGKLLFGLRNSTNFEHLRMNRIGDRFEPCVVVFEDDVKNLQNMSLKTIEASHNNIEMIETGVIRRLPPTLEIIDLSNNKIMFGAYWKELGNLTGLKELYLRVDTELSYMFPQKYPSSKLPCRNNLKTYRKDKQVIEGYKSSRIYRHELVLNLPPRLEKVFMESSSMAYNIDKLHFSRNNSLKEAHLQGNEFQRLIGPVVGLNSLTTLDLSGCYIKTLSNSFLRPFQYLEYLNLSQNLLGDSIHFDRKGDTFSSMANLKYLNMSLNNIFYIFERLFINCTSLEVLDLSANRLQNITFTVSHMKNLSSLNLSKNNIFRLGKSMTDHIGKIFDATHNFKLDLRFNPIACDCTNLHFLKWLTSRKKMLVGDINDYECFFPDSSKKNMREGYSQIVLLLERECQDNQTLFSAVFVVTAFVLAVTFLTVLYRFRWSLRYWFYTVKMMMSRNNKTHSNTDFDYDAFICYAHQDEDFVVQASNVFRSENTNL